MSFLVFLIVLSVLIIVHEFGHFVTAKSLGVRVERFAVGFGPKLFSRMYQGSEFALCLIPLGGYVKMAGDERPQCKGERGEFYAQSPGRRALIILMGPIVNFILAYLCFCVVFLIGYPTLPAKVGELLKNYPAQAAGLQVGDSIIRIDSQEIQSWEKMQHLISTSRKQQLEVVVLREGKECRFTINPRIENLENIFGQKEKIPIIGIRPAEEVVVLRYNIMGSLNESWKKLYEITTTTYKALYRIATGAMSAKDAMTGPIGIFYIIQKAVMLGFSYLLYIVGVISASLAIFNLLPLPVLDGGHLVLSGIEKIRKRPLSPKVEEVINRAGFSLIVGLAVLVFYSDFVRFGIIDKVINLWHKIGR